MNSDSRRHDIDAIRIITIGLLLIYHATIGFQSWGFMVGFITNKTPIAQLWPAMAMLNVWRIPILFFISGMGVYFAIRNRSWKELLVERTTRILVPFIVGVVAIVPIHMVFLQKYYGFPVSYSVNAGHLWFLGNIFVYVLLFMPLFYYLKSNSTAVKIIQSILGKPWGLLLVLLLFVLEALLMKPDLYEMYAMTWHGFVLGMIAFFVGFCFVLAGAAFWKMLAKYVWITLLVAIALYVNRLLSDQMQVDPLLMPVESCFWIFSVFGIGYKFLNRSSSWLNYFRQASYPIYIVHMIPLYLASYLVFPLEISVYLKYVIVVVSTFVGSFLLYEFLLVRIKWLRPLFGLNNKVSDE